MFEIISHLRKKIKEIPTKYFTRIFSINGLSKLSIHMFAQNNILFIENDVNRNNSDDNSNNGK